MKKTLFTITIILMSISCMSQKKKDYKLEIRKCCYNETKFKSILRDEDHIAIIISIEVPAPGSLVVAFNDRSIESFQNFHANIEGKREKKRAILEAYFPCDAFDEFNGLVDIYYKQEGITVDTIKNVGIQKIINSLPPPSFCSDCPLTKEIIRNKMREKILFEMNVWLNEENDEELKDKIRKVYYKRIERLNKKLDMQ